MKELTKQILESGLVDEATAALMEKWGTLPEGSTELTKNKDLESATREELMKLGQRLGDALDKERRLKETMLDLNQLRWPTSVNIFDENASHEVARYVTCVIDRMGRFYFRPQDVKREWFVPGYVFCRTENTKMPAETILEVSELFVGDQVAAIQVSTK